MGILMISLAVAFAGQPDPRFYGTWVGAETYTKQGEAPVTTSAVIVIGDSGQTLAFSQGLLRGRVEISPRWGKNTLDFRVSSTNSLRTSGKLALSADGKTLTETASALLPGQPYAVTCNISGTFHREGKK